MQINVPDDLGITLEEARLDFAIGLYTSGKASLARAAHLAGQSHLDFQRSLSERGIPLNYGVDDLSEDIETLKRLGQL